MKEVEEFRKLSAERRAVELFQLLRENNKLLQDNAGHWSRKHSLTSDRLNNNNNKVNSKITNNLREPNSNQHHNFLPKKQNNAAAHHNHNGTENKNVWKTALNLNSDLHDPWINLIKALYGEDYFDRIRSLAKRNRPSLRICFPGQIFVFLICPHTHTMQ